MVREFLSYYQNGVKLEAINGMPKMIIPPTPVGEFNQIVVEIKNELDKAVALEPYSKDPELEITSYPRMLNKKETGEVIITFRPNRDRLDPLDDEWGFKVLIG